MQKLLLSFRNSRSVGDQHRWKAYLEISTWESRAMTTVGSDSWSNMSSKQQRQYISRLVRRKFQEDHKEALLNLEMQGAAHHKVIEGSQEFDWMRPLTGLSKSLLQFGIHSVANTFPTVDNLRRWSYLRVEEDSCALYGDPKPTITHVLSVCKVAFGEAALDEFNRIKWRHDDVLKEFIDSVGSHMISQGFRVFC